MVTFSAFYLIMTTCDSVPCRCISSFDSAEEKKSNFEGWKSKLAGTLSNSKSVPTTPGVSTAMDARLEGGIELAAELRVKVRSQTSFY